MQIPLRTLSSVEAYIANQEWRNACLPRCPLHPSGGCSFARHGSYPRLNPPGMRIARWYCPEGHRTFSLLPDFMAVKLPGLLETIEDTVATTFSAKSMEAAADALRGLDVTLPSALRWLHRRVRAIVYHVMGLNPPAWQSPPRARPPATALLRAYANHLARCRGNPEVTVRGNLRPSRLHRIYLRYC